MKHFIGAVQAEINRLNEVIARLRAWEKRQSRGVAIRAVTIECPGCKSRVNIPIVGESIDWGAFCEPCKKGFRAGFDHEGCLSAYEVEYELLKKGLHVADR